eukprot:s5681_g6.t1
MLLLGGAATVNALTGVDTNLASFLIPWGVILYTAAGGLKATFMASYLHTAIIFLVLVVCVYTVYVKNFSSDMIYAGLQQVSSYSTAQCEEIFKQGTQTFFEPGKYACGPVPENEGGSYLTMLSGGGTKFGIINIVGNFGTVFVDQSYWQSAIAAKPTSAHKGYLLGGLVWFTIPFALATSLGLCAVALQLPISSSEAGSGLVPPAVATHLFGSFGSVMMAVMLFMAITSTGSAEGIAVSSLVTYDIYKTYINPKCTGQQALFISKVVVVVFGLLMGGLGVALNYMGLNLGWVYQFMGNAIGSAVATGAVVAAWGGMILALATWLIVCQAEFGEITIDNLGTLNPNLAGNIVALLSSALIHAAFSLANPQNYDFESMGKIDTWQVLASVEMLEQDMSGLDDQDYTSEFLDAAKWWIQKWGYGFTILMVLIWPLLSLPAGVFTTDYFAFWVFISIAWSFVATFVIIVLPIQESWGAILGVCYYMVGKVEVCQSSPGTCSESGEGSGGSWRVCGLGDLRPSLSPIRRVFAEPWVLVIPDTPSALEVLLASYFVGGHLTAVGTATQVLTQTEARAFRQSHRFVFLGTVARLPWGKSWPLELRSGASGNTLRLGGCRFAGQYSAVFRAPAEGSEALRALDLVVTALEDQALVDLVSYSFATNQPHTRAPMSNMLPDFMVAGPHFRWKGYGGVVAAGYWDESWQPAPNSAYFRC